MRDLIRSVEDEYRRYKALAEAAIRQLEDDRLTVAPRGSNSIAVVMRHIAGNLRSRFTNFLATDGEKPWRDRDDEFAPRTPTRAELLAEWEAGWRVLLDALTSLTDKQLMDTVTIRRQPLRVHQALHRSLAHVSYHVGQIVAFAKAQVGDRWQSLSIPPGHSEAYGLLPTLEHPVAHVSSLKNSSGTVKVFIQNEAGSDQKHIHDEKTLTYVRTVQVSRPYPFPYGFVVGTTGQDGDNLDCFVLTDHALPTGSLIECRPVGLMEQIEDGLEDHNVLAILASEAGAVEITPDVEARLREFVRHVFDHVPGKRMRVGAFHGAEAAWTHLRRCADQT